jgi:hypothetical protein
MISEPVNNNGNLQSAGFGENAKQIAVLLSIDIVIIIGALLCRDLRNDIGRIVQWSAICLHTPIGIWIGIIMAKSYHKKWTVALYWISVVIPFASFLAPYALRPLRMLFPLGLLPGSIFIQWSILLAILSKRFTKGRWPFPVAILFAISAVILIMFNLSFKTTEFGPLSMFFGNIFASPFFIILPALIRIPANDEIKVYIVKLQYITYVFFILAWVIFGIRVFL